jgi:hypothetical protein
MSKTLAQSIVSMQPMTGPVGKIFTLTDPYARVVPKFTWRNGHPAGYTDDLGIIADYRNQWVEEEMCGWHSLIDLREYHAIREWCEQTLTPDSWCINRQCHYIILQNNEDVAWFILRWA